MRKFALFGAFDYKAKLRQLISTTGTSAAYDDSALLLDEMDKNSPGSLETIHVAAVVCIILKARGVCFFLCEITSDIYRKSLYQPSYG